MYVVSAFGQVASPASKALATDAKASAASVLAVNTLQPTAFKLKRERLGEFIASADEGSAESMP